MKNKTFENIYCIKNYYVIKNFYISRNYCKIIFFFHLKKEKSEALT